WTWAAWTSTPSSGPAPSTIRWGLVPSIFLPKSPPRTPLRAGRVGAERKGRPGVAAAWRDKTGSTPGRRKKLPSLHDGAGMIAGLSALWRKGFLDHLKVVQANPWQDVGLPKADKLPGKYATDDMIVPFSDYRMVFPERPVLTSHL